MVVDINELQKWDEKILKLVNSFGLNPYPQEFEICDHNEMIGYMAYTGMPSHYSHWSYGKGFERQKTLYEHGVSGLPYEMVINSNPCVAYLMRDNSLLLQVLTIAHVYGHNDFFANNFTFTSATDAKYTLETFRNHAHRISNYMEDPSIGLEAVESTIDHAHAISMQVNKNLGIRKQSQDEIRMRKWEAAQDPEDPYANIHPKKEYVAPDLKKVPLEPDEDLLSFIADHNPFLPEWKKDILRIVEKQAKYFIPQMETKIMNEGWASYWHHKILNSLDLPKNLYMEFMVRHNQVLRPQPGGLNPYHLGFCIWHDIEKRWNEGRTGKEFSKEEKPDLTNLDENDTPGRKKIFEVRRSDRDTSFIRRFLTMELMQELELFQHEKRGKDRVITKVADEESWTEVKETLIKNIGANSIPIIKIEDSDFDSKRTLYLKHYHDGRDLQLEYAEHTLKHIQALWEREVVLETILNGKASLLKLTDGTLKIDKL
ncbi:MAG: SpoVR family protein [SAR324 cluster bacterium]|uniref:SpoVR family protein n=1 Tax=SAR324 cluster bacterium TaxID=2024889 RepID=A0A7X9FRS8_9DELT|nr:SpoVR family protein [SAR324 cluster bacterium]